MNYKNRWIFILLAVLTVIDIYAVNLDHSNLRFFTKPLLMPLLITAFVIGHDRKNVYSRLMISGLFFSWLGDIFLMLESSDGIYFIIGLSCFLTTHILYIFYFLNIKAEGTPYLKLHPYLLAFVAIYGVGLLYLLWPGLGELKIPVSVYATIICIMLSIALWQYQRIETHTAKRFILGALLFVLSDSVLAINKFKQPLPFGGIIIMTTYVAAQVMIVLGSLSHQRQQLPRDLPSFVS